MSFDQKEEHEDSHYLVGSAAAEILKAVQSGEESRIVYSERVEVQTLRSFVCRKICRCQGLIERLITNTIPELFQEQILESS
jgi:hypothetical protein